MILKNKKIYGVLFLAGIIFRIEFVFSETIDSYVKLEEGVYGNTITLEESLRLYETIQNNVTLQQDIKDTYYVKIMSEKLLGDKFLQNNNEQEAKKHYEKGLAFAQKYLEIEKNDYSYAFISLMISMNTQVNPFSYTLANGIPLEKNAKKSLEINKKNPIGLFLYASCFIFAPSALANVKKGIKILLTEQDIRASKAEIFQIYQTLVKAYIKIEDYENAKEFQKKCEALFPQNSEVLQIKAILETK